MSKVLEIAKNSKKCAGFMAAVKTAQKNILLADIALKLIRTFGRNCCCK